MKKLILYLFLLLPVFLFSQGFPVGTTDQLTGDKKLRLYDVDASGSDLFLPIDTLYSFLFDTLGLSASHGNILYVSKDGDNATAQKGNILFPFADPWEAKDNANAGDLVYILPGTYTTDDNPTSSNNLFKDSISFYAQPGVKIQLLTTTKGNYLIQGLGDTNDFNKFEFLGHAALWDGYIRISDSEDSLVANIELEELNMDFNRVAQGGMAVVLTSLPGSLYNVNIKKFLNNGVSFTGVRTSATDGDIHVNIDYFKSISSVSDMNSGIFIDSHIRSKSSYNVGTMIQLAPLAGHNFSTEANVPNGISLYRADTPFEDSQIDISCDNFIFDSTNGYSGTTFADPNQNDGGAMFETCSSIYNATALRTKVNVNFKNCYSPQPIIRVHFNTASTGNQYNIKLGNVETFGTCAVSVANMASTGTGRVFINGDNVKSTNSSVIHSYGSGTDKVVFSGTFESTNAGSAVANLSKVVSFSNARLINDGTAASIVSASALNIPIMSVYANSTVSNANTTEIIEPIIKDSNIQ